MPRRQRPVGRLTQKPKAKKNISENKYRVLAENARENTLWTHGEYKSFNEDPVIGKHEVQNFEHCVWLQVAHEVSHHVQYAICPHIKRFSRRGSKSYFKPHGDGFKAIYRYLRKDFINPLIDANESYFDHWFSREDLI